jgi:hypothetical protein
MTSGGSLDGGAKRAQGSTIGALCSGRNGGKAEGAFRADGHTAEPAAAAGTAAALREILRCARAEEDPHTKVASFTQSVRVTRTQPFVTTL